MLFVYGHRFYGRIWRAGTDPDASYVATRFFHMWFMPLFPLGTHVVFGGRAMRARMSGRSVLAAYLRTWGVLLGASAVIGAMSMFTAAMERGALGDLVLAPLIVFVTVATVAAAFFSLGRLSAAEQAQHEVYARFVGARIDPVLIAERREMVRAQVERALSERGQALGLLGYRNEGAGAADWLAMAESPAVRDVDFLESALTMARLDQVEARGDKRRELVARHARIWSRLEELRPSAGSDTASTAAA